MVYMTYCLYEKFNEYEPGKAPGAMLIIKLDERSINSILPVNCNSVAPMEVTLFNFTINLVTVEYCTRVGTWVKLLLVRSKVSMGVVTGNRAKIGDRAELTRPLLAQLIVSVVVLPVDTLHRHGAMIGR